MANRYWTADRAGRSQLLTEMAAVTELHRKSLLRRLHASTLARQRRRTPRGRTSGPAVADVSRVVWESLDSICAERLTPNLLSTAQHLASFGELVLTPELEAQLATVSRATVQRLRCRFQQETPRLPRRGPELANRLAQTIPMGRLPWNTAEPGHCEVDLVHHCGPATVGDYVQTLQMVDVATGWRERAGVLGRSQRAMEGGFRRIQARLPFPIRQLHPDNGAEFLNDHLVRDWGETITGLTLSRSRPYQKNDNRFVEQKNATLVRAYLGHRRLSTEAPCAAVNALSDQLWVSDNLFQPVLHLVDKTVAAGRVKRQWDAATTPYQRLLATKVLDAAQQARLAALHWQTNPRQLRQAIDHTIATLWDEPAAAADLAHTLILASRKGTRNDFPRKEAAAPGTMLI